MHTGENTYEYLRVIFTVIALNVKILLMSTATWAILL